MRIRVAELALVVILLMNFAVILTGAQPSQPHNADAMWVEPSDSNFDANTTSVGFKFNVTVAMNFTEDTFAWQAVLYYNATQLNATRVGATAPPTSEFMTGHSTTFSKAIGPGSYPPVGDLKSVLAAETCSAPDFVTGPQSGTLFWTEFQIMLAPGAGQTLNSTFDISTEYSLTNTYVWDPTGNPYTFTPYDGTYQFTNSSGPPPPLSVSISPPSATISVNQSLPFTSTVSGGNPPYNFQWFMNFSAVPGATSSSFVFATPSAGSTIIYLEVTDNNGTTVQSNNASVTVLPTPPVGASSITVTPTNSTNPTGTTHTVIATVRDNLTNPIPNCTVHFNIYAGPNAGLSGTNVTNANGEAYFSWTSFLAGTDQMNATAQSPSNPTVTIFDDKASKTWIQATRFTLTVYVRSTSTNQSLSGATVAALGPENRSGTTDGGAVVFDSIQAGIYTVTASKPGYTSASMSLNLTNDTQITLWLTPMTRELKKEAIAELEDAKRFTNDKCIEEKIDKAIEEIDESLNPNLWVDDFHLDPKHGAKVFQEEKDAVGKLMNILKDKATGSAVKNIIQAVIGKLLLIDQLLANTAIKDAKALGSTNRRVIHEIKEAGREFCEAIREIKKKNYDDAVEEFKHAWMHAEHAMQKTFGDVNCDGRVDGKDQVLIGLVWGSSPYRPNWNPAADLNDDGRLDMKDMGLWALNFGNAYN